MVFFGGLSFIVVFFVCVFCFVCFWCFLLWFFIWGGVGGGGVHYTEIHFHE